MRLHGRAPMLNEMPTQLGQISPALDGVVPTFTRFSRRGADVGDHRDGGCETFGFDMRGVDWLQYRLRRLDPRRNVFRDGSTASRRFTRIDSRTMRAMGLMLEKLANTSGAISCGTTPADCLKPTTPLAAAGMRVEPPASVPTPMAQRPAASATPAPPDDPPDVRSAAQALRVRPNKGASV